MTVIVQNQNDVVILADSKKNYVAALKGTVIINNSNGTGNSTVNLSFNQANGFTGNFTNGNLTIDLQNANTTQSGKLTSTDWQRLDGAVGNVTLAQSNITALQNQSTNLSGQINAVNLTVNNHTSDIAGLQNITSANAGNITTLQDNATNITSSLSNKLNISEKGAANGVAELVNGTVPISQLPSYVDDVIEAVNFAALPVTGESGKIYVTLDDNLTYRWSGSTYSEISKSLALGETSATAYRGDRGAIAYNHSQLTHDKAFVGLTNVDNTSDLDKPISNATQTALNTKANANLTINGQSLNGNVTLTTANISDSTDKRYVNETQLSALNNVTNIHSSLTNLTWTTSGHTGNVSSIPAFDSLGQPTLLTQNGSGSVALTSNVSLTNADLTTPILGTPQSGNLTNCDGNATNLTAGNVNNLNVTGGSTTITGILNTTNGGTGANVTGLVLALQRVDNVTSTYSNGTTAIPNDNTPPQSSEGTLFLAKTITPKTVNSTLIIEINSFLSCNVGGSLVITGAIFANTSGASAIRATQVPIPANNATIQLSLTDRITPNTTSPVNVTFRAGQNSGFLVSQNGIASGAMLGGTAKSSLVITEIIETP